MEWAGAITGITGSALIAVGLVGAGFVLFFLSNVLWIGYGLRKEASGLLAMQSAYCITSLWGIWAWLGR